MPLAFILLMYLFQALRVPAYSATVDSISAGEALVGDAKLVSSNGRYALGFYNPGSKSGQTPKSWYLGISFN